jgi:hypothetical protein
MISWNSLLLLRSQTNYAQNNLQVEISTIYYVNFNKDSWILHICARLFPYAPDWKLQYFPANPTKNCPLSIHWTYKNTHTTNSSVSRRLYFSLHENRKSIFLHLIATFLIEENLRVCNYCVYARVCKWFQGYGARSQHYYCCAAQVLCV